MNSICYVIIPDEDYNNNLEGYIKDILSKYYLELEIEPYKEFKSEEDTYRMAKLRGFEKDLKSYGEYLKENESDAGIENGLLYYISTYNTAWRWDRYSISDINKYGSDLLKEPPYSIVTLDGVWQSMKDFNYLPVLDFDNDFKLHKDNIKPKEKWEQLYNSLCEENLERHFLILNIHS